MAKAVFKSSKMSQKLDARPDRVDFRDRPYLPPLRSLPPQWPPKNKVAEFIHLYKPLIRNQFNDGACTGFGLAAMINYIYWYADIMQQLQANGGNIEKIAMPKCPLVSEHMLYQNARLYDEWEGEDYEGSSCRGAMKGWHKHGVCELVLWKKDLPLQEKGWETDAAKRPLGAYYRVDARSISDMQAAIFETGAVYASGDVHQGWDDPIERQTGDGLKIATIMRDAKKTGGHAFAIVGFTPDGFIIQNSWGPEWGTLGFALLSYEDWIINGYDAWVAAIGAPMQISSPLTAGHASLAMSGINNMVTLAKAGPAKAGKAVAVGAWSAEQAYQHAVVMGNDGKLVNRIVGAKETDHALDNVLLNNIGDSPHQRIALYVHGGLNDEEAAINRARRLGPWFDANGIFPVFVIWRTGLMESLGGIAQDEIAKFEEQANAIRAKGIGGVFKAALDALAEAKDRAFEVAAEKTIGKPVWTQMKQNAFLAGKSDGALAKILSRLDRHEKRSVHLIGHSAGSIMIGHLLDVARQTNAKTRFQTCDLYAPACRLDFATEKFGMAMQKGGSLHGGKLNIDILTDKAEVSDSVGPYGKSLLYLVSRALEERHKAPLLGLELCLDLGKKQSDPGMKLDQDELALAYQDWHAKVVSHGNTTVVAHSGPQVVTAPKQKIPIAHGSFDNDIDIVNASLERILGAKPKVPVVDLTGF